MYLFHIQNGNITSFRSGVLIALTCPLKNMFPSYTITASWICPFFGIKFFFSIFSLMPLMQCKCVFPCDICWVFSTSYLRCVTWLTILNNFGRNARIEVVVSMTIKEGFVVKQRRDSQRKLRADTFCKKEQKKSHKSELLILHNYGHQNN